MQCCKLDGAEIGGFDVLVCIVDWSFTGLFARSCIARVARFELARNEAESADSCLQAMLLLSRSATKIALQSARFLQYISCSRRWAITANYQASEARFILRVSLVSGASPSYYH